MATQVEQRRVCLISGDLIARRVVGRRLGHRHRLVLGVGRGLRHRLVLSVGRDLGVGSRRRHLKSGCIGTIVRLVVVNIRSRLLLIVGHGGVCRSRIWVNIELLLLRVGLNGVGRWRNWSD